MPAFPALEPEHIRLAEQLAFGLGRLDRELRGPLAEAWSWVPPCSPAPPRPRTAASRRFAAACSPPRPGCRSPSIARMLGSRPRCATSRSKGLVAAVACSAEDSPAGRRPAWSPNSSACGARGFRLGRRQPTTLFSARGGTLRCWPAALQALWGRVRRRRGRGVGGDPMALSIAFPLALQAQGFCARPLPGLFPRPRPPRPAARWFRLALEDLIARLSLATQLLHGLERARHGLAQAVAGARSSSRLPAVADLALTAPAIAAPTVVRHLTRLARRGGPLGRTRPETVVARKTAISAAGAGALLRQLAASGWLVELTGSRTHRAYVPRDLADLGIDVQPARLRPPPGRKFEEEAFEIPPLPSPGERKARLEVDYTEVFTELRLVESRIEALLTDMRLGRRVATEGSDIM